MYENDDVVFYARRLDEALTDLNKVCEALDRAKEICWKRQADRKQKRDSDFPPAEIYIDTRTVALLTRERVYVSPSYWLDIKESGTFHDWAMYILAVQGVISTLKGRVTRYRNQLKKAAQKEPGGRGKSPAVVFRGEMSCARAVLS